MQQDPFQIQSRTVSFHLCGKLFWSGGQVSRGHQASPASAQHPLHCLLTREQRVPPPASPTQKLDEGWDGDHAKAGNSPWQNLLFLLVCGAQQNPLHGQEHGRALGWLGSIREQRLSREVCVEYGYVETCRCSAREQEILQEPLWLLGSDILVIQSSVSSHCHQLPSQLTLLSCYPGASQNLLTSTFSLPACWHVSLLPGTHRGEDLIGPTSHDTKSQLSIGQQPAPQHPVGRLSL